MVTTRRTSNRSKSKIKNRGGSKNNKKSKKNIKDELSLAEQMAYDNNIDMFDLPDNNLIDDGGHLKSIIIGAGVAGVFTSKELYQHGEREFLCFDSLPRAGGVYARYSYPDMHFTTSTQTAAFSDFPWKGEPKHWSIPEFVEYLDDYIEHYQFGNHLIYNSRVEYCRRIFKDGNIVWEVLVHQGNFFEHFSEDESVRKRKENMEEEWILYTTDHLVVASGTHNYWAYPEYKGLDTFEGDVYHSSMFHDIKDNFKNKTVLLVGTGESGCDMAKLVSDICGKLHVSLRHHSGVYFPRHFEEVPADTVDCRYLYALSRTFTPFVARGFYRRFLKHSTDKDLFCMAADANWENERSAFNSYGVKTFDLFLSVRDNATELQPGIKEFDGTEVVFTDDTRMEVDAVLFCTGYTLKWPFFKRFEPTLANELMQIRKQWKHMVNPDLGDKLFLAGFARPNMTSVMIVADVQARAAAAVIAGKLKLPSNKQMLKDIKDDRDYYYKEFGEHTATRALALVDHLKYNDELAEYMGASPPYLKAILKGDFKLWIHLMLASLNGAHYRFQGPNSDWNLAADTVKNIPLHKHYVRACLRLHTSAFFAHLVSSFFSLFIPSWRPVGAMKNWPKYFWGTIFIIMIIIYYNCYL